MIDYYNSKTSQTIAINTDYVDFITYDEVDTAVSTATLAGWGATEAGFDPSIRLRKTNVTLSGVNCTSDYGSDFNRKTMICGGDGINQTVPKQSQTTVSFT